MQIVNETLNNFFSCIQYSLRKCPRWQKVHVVFKYLSRADIYRRLPTYVAWQASTTNRVDVPARQCAGESIPGLLKGTVA